MLDGNAYWVWDLVSKVNVIGDFGSADQPGPIREDVRFWINLEAKFGTARNRSGKQIKSCPIPIKIWIQVAFIGFSHMV